MARRRYRQRNVKNIPKRPSSLLHADTVFSIKNAFNLKGVSRRTQNDVVRSVGILTDRRRPTISNVNKAVEVKNSLPRHIQRQFSPETLREVQRIKECRSRHARREVLFALKRTGKGSGAPKKYDDRSKIKC